jgi:hypothetical protein
MTKIITKTVKKGWYGETDIIKYDKTEIKPNVAEHTQIIHFVTGHKKTISNIIRIDEGEMLCLTTKSGKEFLINKEKVEITERYIN